MDFLWNAMLALGIFLGFLWLANEINTRAPRQDFDRLFAGRNDREFHATILVDDFALEEFRAEFVDEWECGFKFYAAGHGPISFVTDDERRDRSGSDASLPIDELEKLEKAEAKSRSTFRFFSDDDALKNDTIIGWARMNENARYGRTSDVRIFLPSAAIHSLLSELRRGVPQRMEANGFENEHKRIQITGFSMAPVE